jgi:hypothetical protein
MYLQKEWAPLFVTSFNKKMLVFKKAEAASKLLTFCVNQPQRRWSASLSYSASKANKKSRQSGFLRRRWWSPKDIITRGVTFGEQSSIIIPDRLSASGWPKGAQFSLGMFKSCDEESRRAAAQIDWARTQISALTLSQNEKHELWSYIHHISREQTE